MRVEQAVPVVARLRSFGAHRGAATVAFHALMAATAPKAVWTPSGPLPLPANDVRSPFIPQIIA